ncbi:MAG: ABC transporter permease [Bacteroidales bacterium]|nr:ABC transporter permease [Bacteroidales bacterium]
MKTFLSLLYKDFLLLLRDKAGLFLLFVMPLSLVLIMTSMQDGMMKSVINTNVSLLLLNNDKDSLGNAIEKELQKSDIFQMQSAKELDSCMTEEDLINLIAKGEYLIGIYIPDSMTYLFIEEYKNALFQAFMGQQISQDTVQKMKLSVYLDPTVKPSVHSSLMSNIRAFFMEIQNRFSLKVISKMLETISGNKIKNLDLSECQGLTINERIADKGGEEGFRPNAVQHNVPAWTLFAIFFIVISLAGSIIKEREDGSFNRLMTMPCSYTHYLSSKIIIYLIVCILQFLGVLAMGIWIFPLIGMEAFIIDGFFINLLLVIICAACAAICFGISISAIATSQQQASIFGAISVVILAAIGGIWVPTFVMPDFLKFISNISPMNWAIDASYSIILRKSTVIEVLPDCIYLLTFALVCFFVAIFYKKYKR